MSRNYPNQSSKSNLGIFLGHQSYKLIICDPSIFVKVSTLDHPVDLWQTDIAADLTRYSV
jgi:hypothetical protein